MGLDLLILFIALLLVLVGLVGSVVPIIPSTSLAFLGVLLYKFSDCCTYSWTWVIVLGIITIIVIGLDYYIPIYGAKKFGGTKYGSYGATIGLLIGLFAFPPFGFIIGAIVGAFVGELIKNKNNINGAFKSALGSFVGFLLSSGISLIVCGGMLALILFRNSCWFN